MVCLPMYVTRPRLKRETPTCHPFLQKQVWRRTATRSYLKSIIFNLHCSCDMSHVRAITNSASAYSDLFLLLLLPLMSLTINKQCDQIGRFFGNYKSSPNAWILFGPLWNSSLFKSTLWGYYLENSCKNFGYFLYQHLVTLLKWPDWAIFESSRYKICVQK